MKKLNKKGFSLVELLAVVAILAILMGLGIAAYSRYTQKAKNDSYNMMVKSAENAMDEYLMDHPGETTVTFEELYNNNYLERPSDPSSKTEMCRGKVISTIDEESTGELEKRNYKVSVCCANYNYTYEMDTGYKAIDKYCKADPFSLEQLKEILTEIKVLNVYPNKTYANYVKKWMEESKDAKTGELIGKGLIKVTPVFIGDFNANPESYLGTNGQWKYDEIVFGFSDCNSNKDLNAHSAALVDEYLTNGGAAIFGHDTLTVKGCGSHVNFNTLAKHVNMTLGKDGYRTSTKVKIIKKGVFTQYPWNIENIANENGGLLTIPSSHVYGQVASGDVWITFTGSSEIDAQTPANKIYLSTYGNNAFIQTGHSSGQAKEHEQKIIANIIFYMVAKQYISE